MKMQIFGGEFEHIDLPSFCKGVSTQCKEHSGEYPVKRIMSVQVSMDTLLVHAELNADDPNLRPKEVILLEKPLSPSSIDRAAPVLVTEPNKLAF